MNSYYNLTGRTITIVAMITCFFLCNPAIAFTGSENIVDTLSPEQTKLLNGDPLVVLSSLNNGVTGVTGKIFIAASRKKVWEILTDYNHQKDFIPNIIESGLISENGVEQIVFQAGKARILIFQILVHVKLKVQGEYLEHLDFQQITGDFKVYKGGWILEEYPQEHGTFLYYKAEIKPDFFSPSFIVKHVQKHDFPLMLSALKARAESINFPGPK
jgi:ribosome-associated toxin RatA of RatAB toxin-antitoxin module